MYVDLCMYMYIYIHTYTFVVCIYIQIYIYICACVYIHTYICIHVVHTSRLSWDVDSEPLLLTSSHTTLPILGSEAVAKSEAPNHGDTKTGGSTSLQV